MSALSASQAIHVSPQQLNRPQQVPPHALVRMTPMGISIATPTTDTMTACARAGLQCSLAQSRHTSKNHALRCLTIQGAGSL